MDHSTFISYTSRGKKTFRVDLVTVGSINPIEKHRPYTKYREILVMSKRYIYIFF